MINLIKSQLVKYFRNPLFFIAVVVSLTTGIYGGVRCTDFKDDTNVVINCRVEVMWMLTAIWACIVLIAMCAGKEFSDGIIRNKIVAGHTKISVFLAEIIVATIMTVIMYLLNIIPTAIGGWYFIGEIPVLFAVKWFVNIFLTFELMSIFTVVITYILAKRAVAVVASFALHFILYIISGFTDGYYYNIGEPKMSTMTFYIMYDDGTIEEREQECENGYYTEGVQQVLVQIEHAVNPMYGLIDAINFGYIPDKTNVDNSLLNEEKKRIRDLNFDIIKMSAYCIMAYCIGAYLFYKKDLK